MGLCLGACLDSSAVQLLISNVLALCRPPTPSACHTCTPCKPAASASLCTSGMMPPTRGCGQTCMVGWTPPSLWRCGSSRRPVSHILDPSRQLGYLPSLPPDHALKSPLVSQVPSTTRLLASTHPLPPPHTHPHPQCMYPSIHPLTGHHLHDLPTHQQDTLQDPPRRCRTNTGSKPVGRRGERAVLAGNSATYTHSPCTTPAAAERI